MSCHLTHEQQAFLTIQTQSQREAVKRLSLLFLLFRKERAGSMEEKGAGKHFLKFKLKCDAPLGYFYLKKEKSEEVGLSGKSSLVTILLEKFLSMINARTDKSTTL